MQPERPHIPNPKDWYWNDTRFTIFAVDMVKCMWSQTEDAKIDVFGRVLLIDSQTNEKGQSIFVVKNMPLNDWLIWKSQNQECLLKE